MADITCALTGRTLGHDEARKGSDLRPQLFDLIRSENAAFGPDSFIAPEVLNRYRRSYVTGLVAQEAGEVDRLEQEVIDAISADKMLSVNLEEESGSSDTFGQRVADRIAVFGGSWTFILSFFGFLALWIVANIWLLGRRTFDPYPFILLNLILSCIASIQAPIIMMSQNRQEQKDRVRSEHDYKVNLKAEIEIRLLHEKIDHLLVHQNRRLLEIQQIQSDYLEDILTEMKGRKEG